MKTFFWVLFIILIIVAAMSLEVWLVTILWNWLMPMLFGLKEISFWAALGLVLLIDLIFGGGLLSRKG